MEINYGTMTLGFIAKTYPPYTLKFNMSSIEDKDVLETLTSEARESRPGILPKDTKVDSYIGHTVINLSNTPLDHNQIKALEKGLTFCPTPGPPDKSQIWLDFKEFHRRLELLEFVG